MIATLLALAPAALAGDVSYDGRLADHPELPALLQALEEGAEAAAEGLPKWVAKDPPAFRVELRDRTDAPLERFEFPGVGASDIAWSGAEREWTLTFEADVLLGFPDLARRLVLRQLFFAATLAQSDGSPEQIVRLSPANPLIHAIGSFVAGTLEEEARWAMGLHYHTPTEARRAVGELVEGAGVHGGYVAPSDRNDLTFPALLLFIAPRGKDGKVAKLYDAVRDGRPMHAAVKKVTGKKLEKLNDILAGEWLEWLEERSAEDEVALVVRALLVGGSGRWEELVEDLDDASQPYLRGKRGLGESWAAAELLFYAAQAHENTGNAEGAREAYRTVAESSVVAPVVGYACLRLGELLAEEGDVPGARAMLERARDHFGWYESVRSSADQRLGTL